jgi:hypothetical protein
MPIAVYNIFENCKSWLEIFSDVLNKASV